MYKVFTVISISSGNYLNVKMSIFTLNYSTNEHWGGGGEYKKVVRAPLFILNYMKAGLSTV